MQNQIKKLYLVDVSSWIFRAYYALPVLTTSQGHPTNATLGVFNMMLGLLKKAQAEGAAVIICKDSKEGSKRKEIYPEYKANRQAPPESLIPQFNDIDEGMDALGLPHLRVHGIEADDIIASICARGFPEGEIHIVSGDKDLFQLVGDKIFVVDTMKHVVYDQQKVFEKLGVYPHQVLDYLALVGDSSDNIPGVPGVGPKTAAQWLQKYGSLSGLYDSLDELTEKKRQLLIENRHLAEVSRSLASLDQTIDINHLSLDPFVEADWAQFLDFCKRLELKSLISKISLEAKNQAFEVEKKEDQQIEKELEKELRTSVVVDESLLRDDAIMVLCVKDSVYLQSKNQIFDFSKDDTKGWGSFLETSSLICGYSLKDLIRHWGVFSERPLYDLDLMAYLMDPEKKRSPEMWLSDFQENLDQGFQRLKVSVSQLMKDLKDRELWNLYVQMDSKMPFVLASMESRGIQVDRELLSQLSLEYHQHIELLEKRIYEIVGYELNLNSPKQLSEALFDRLGLPVQRKTKTGFSTDSDVLEQLSGLHEVPKLLLKYREYTKLKSTYLDVFPGMLTESSRLHARFHQAVTATGRLSSSDPNLQNIPIRSEAGRALRKAFIAKPGFKLVGADYSQVELRILAHLTQDEVLLKSFSSGEDIHRHTASEIFGLPVEQVTSEQRSVAKAINFGLIYGKTAFGLAQELKISRSDAAVYISRYFDRYKKVKPYLVESVEQARKKGYAETLMGRRRYIQDIDSKNQNIRSNAERIAMNAPLQGTAADIIKVAMIRLHEQGAPLVAQVHDELLLEVPEKEASDWEQILIREMESAAHLSVPLLVSSAIGDSWSDFI